MKQSLKDKIMEEVQITVERLEKHLKAAMYQHFTEQESRTEDRPGPARPFTVQKKHNGYKKPEWK